MPRNAQWTSQEDQELTKLTLRNSKENNGIIDWDEIHDLRRGQIARRSKNAMISRWWKIKETQDYDINDNNDDLHDITDLNDDAKENGIDNKHSNEDDDNDDDMTVNGNDEHVAIDINIEHQQPADIDMDIDMNDMARNNKKRKRRKKRKSNPMQNIIHSLLSNKYKINCQDSSGSISDANDANEEEEGEEEEDAISYKNYYRHDIATLKLTSFTLTTLKPYIRAFEQQILINHNMNHDETANASQYISENKNLRKTIILQNKFLTELYTKIQHQQGIVREMVECDEKLKFKLKYIHQQQTIFNREMFAKNQQISKLQEIIVNNDEQTQNNQIVSVLKILNVLSERVVAENLLNDLHAVMSLMDNLLQIVEIQTAAQPQTLTVKQLMASLKVKLYAILNNTPGPFAKNIQDIESRKRKRPQSHCMAMDDTEDMTANPIKKQKISNKQLSLPMINGKPPPPVFTSINNENNTNNNENPPPLPPPPPPITIANNGAANSNNQKSMCGIDLLLQVAMLDNKQTPK